MATHWTNVLLSCLNSLDFRSIWHRRKVRKHLLCFIFIPFLEIQTVNINLKLCVCAHILMCMCIYEIRTEKMIVILLQILLYHMAVSYILWFKAVVDATAKIREYVNTISLQSGSNRTSAQAVVPPLSILGFRRAWLLSHSLFRTYSFMSRPIPVHSCPIVPASNLGSLYLLVFMLLGFCSSSYFK